MFIAALSFALHIIFIDIFMKELNSPFLFGSIQYFIVFILSMILAFIWEEPKISNMQIEWFEILYTGIFSAGIGCKGSSRAPVFYTAGLNGLKRMP